MTTYCGVDFHARQQLVKWCNTEDGEIRERQLWPQSKDEVLAFYAQFDGRVIVGFESSGYSSWFETMLEQLGHKYGSVMPLRFVAGRDHDKRQTAATPN